METGFLLSLNVGSSSLKFSVYEASNDLPLRLTGGIERIGKPGTVLKVTRTEPSPSWEREGPVPQEREGEGVIPPAGENTLTRPAAPADLSHEGEVKTLEDALPAIADALKTAGIAPLAAIAHRIVHGGPQFSDHQRVTPELLAGLRKVEALAPNHLPPEIAFVEAALKQFSDAPHFACFDTVFHRDLPPVARRLPLPRRLEAQGVRRYGFHGLSYQYIMGKLPDYIGDRAQGRVIVAHLGSGAGMAAVKSGRSIDTTMGLTPLGGLVMATRPGDLDPGIVGYLAKTQGLSVEQFEHMAYAESGLLGVSETSGDVRDLLAREGDDPRAAEALALFCYGVRKAAGALAAALQGVDVLVFTGGIGANSPVLRQRICDDLDWLGVTLDMGANAHGEQCISAPRSKVMVFAMATDEERVMAEITFRLLGNPYCKIP